MGSTTSPSRPPFPKTQVQAFTSLPVVKKVFFSKIHDSSRPHPLSDQLGDTSDGNSLDETLGLTARLGKA